MKLKFLFILLSIFIYPVYSLNQIIIKFKPSKIQMAQFENNTINLKQLNAQLMQPYSKSLMNSINSLSNKNFYDKSSIATGAHVLDSDEVISEDELNQIVSNLSQLDDVQYVEVNKFYKKNSFDSQYGSFQWDMFGSTNGSVAGLDPSVSPNVYGDNFSGMLELWRTIFNGISAVDPGFRVRVGVIDTGYTKNPNISLKLQPINPQSQQFGYDFISDCRIAGTCPVSTPNNQAMKKPTPDALDYGDYLTESMIANSNGFFRQCPPENNSSWHGTHVSGTIVGLRTQSQSTAKYALGGAFGAMAEPVRVLGKCGGTTQDIANGIMWAANLHPSITNLYPVDVISMSLGGSGACSGAMADAISQAQMANPKLIFVIAAGNSTMDFKNFSPANCPNVISVSAVSPLNNLAFYSNYGNTTITATGGDKYPYMVTSIDPNIATKYYNQSGTYSSLWASSQAYNNADGPIWAYYMGTSMATPHVSALVADIISFIRYAPGIFNRNYDVNTIVDILHTPSNHNFNKCNNTGYYSEMHHIGGCVTSGRMDAQASLKYAQQKFGVAK